MPLPQHLRYGEGGTVSLDLSTLPSAVTAKIVDDGGTEMLGHTAATISAVNTTLSTALSRGDVEMNVVSNTGMEVGVTCYLQDDPEDVLIRKVAGTTVSLRRPAMHDHIATAVIEGGRVTLAVSAATANTLFWSGHVEWNVAGETEYTAVECTKYGVAAKPSVQDLFDVEPQLEHILPAETDLSRHCDAAMQFVYGKIAKSSPDLRTRVFCGSQEFRTATALAAMHLHYRTKLDGGELAERYNGAVDAEIATMMGVIPRDANQDGVISAGERVSFRSVKVSR